MNNNSKEFFPQNNILTGFNKSDVQLTDISAVNPKALSEIGMTDDQVISALNLPPRDEVKYPDPDQDLQIKAGAFLMKLNMLASSYDGNLKAMIWKFYVDLEKYLTTDTNAQDLIDMVANLDNLRDYIKDSDNILFKEIDNK